MHTVNDTLPNADRRRAAWALGGIGFTLFFLAGDVFNATMLTGDVIMPGAPASEVVAFYRTNSTATTLVGLVQLSSAVALLCFAGRVASLTRAVTDSRLRAIGAVSGTVAGAALAVSASIGLVLSRIATEVPADAVGALRQANFLTGGVVHVVTLGVFAATTCLVLGRAGAIARSARVLGLVAAVPAILSVSSLLWYYASVFLPLGRILLMTWAVFAAISLFRRSR
jgi:hypothetical protein